MFNIAYIADNVVSVTTDVEAPNINSVVERLFGSVRREALDNFLIFGRAQIVAILEEYVVFYYSQRPHHGIQQQIPKPGELEKKCGAVCRSGVPGGLQHNYYRRAA